MGPFYCPIDRKVYLDTSFFQDLERRFRACDAGSKTCQFSQAYVITHEVGHHVQNLLGILPRVQRMQQGMDQVEANQNTRDVYAQQFDIGQRSLLDLLDATNELFLSKNDLITANYEELFANYRILASQGELVQSLGVAFPTEATPGEAEFETKVPGETNGG